MSREPGVAPSVARACLLPAVLGVALGFALVVIVLRLGRHTVPSDTPTPNTASSPVPRSRVIVLLIGADEQRVVGFWEYWSAPTVVACVASNDFLIKPQGRELGEILANALAVGDDSWVAETARHLATDCQTGLAGTESQVVLVTQAGLAALVDAAGGIEVDGDLMNGGAAWEYISFPSFPPAEIQAHQRAVWLGLAARLRSSPPASCARILNAAALFRSVPPAQDACDQLESILRQTPPRVRTP